MSKFNNKKTLCLSNHLHDSIFEASYCGRLRAMKQSGEIIGYAPQVGFDLVVKDVLICKHNVDFFVQVKKNVYEVHETKGVKTKDWSIKHKLFKVLFPDIKYIVISKGGNSRWTRTSRKRSLSVGQKKLRSILS